MTKQEVWPKKRAEGFGPKLPDRGREEEVVLDDSVYRNQEVKGSVKGRAGSNRWESFSHQAFPSSTHRRIPVSTIIFYWDRGVREGILD